MSLWNLLKPIKAAPALADYAEITFQFLSYLTATSITKFRVEGYKRLDSSPVDHDLPYVHRWTTIYRNSILARLYLLDDWYRENPSPVTMLTLTTYQDGPTSILVKGRLVTIEESFEILAEGKTKVMKMMRKNLPSVPYVAIMEPHQSGYPHLHIVVFADINQALQERLKRLWSEKYGAGSYAHGLDFEARTPTSIESVRNYLMKYVAKGFVNTGSKFSVLDIPWTAEQLVYNALVWKHGYRTFQPSRDLCRVMACPRCDTDGFDWLRNTLIDENGDEHVIWDKTVSTVT